MDFKHIILKLVTMTKQFKNMWIIVFKRGDYLLYTITVLKKDCIAEFIKDSNFTWEHCKEIGWKCVKVKISIEPELTNNNK